jgi:hypothetical protein
VSAPPALHQATVFLPGRFEEGRFTSPCLPPEVTVRLGGFARRKPQYLAGEGVFSHWPRTNTAGEIISLTLVDRLRQPPPDSAVQVQGILLRVTGRTLTILIEPETKKIKPFRIHLRRAGALTGRLELNRPYRVEGRLEGMQLIAERARPLEWPRAPREAGSAPPPAQKKKAAPPPASTKPAPPPGPAQPAPAPPASSPEAQAPAERPPPLKRGQQLAIVGSGPYYLVLAPPAVQTWWPKVEQMLPDLPRRHTVHSYPNGSRAVVVDDLVALKTWYKRLRAS